MDPVGSCRQLPVNLGHCRISRKSGKRRSERGLWNFCVTTWTLLCKRKESSRRDSHSRTKSMAMATFKSVSTSESECRMSSHPTMTSNRKTQQRGPIYVPQWKKPQSNISRVPLHTRAYVVGEEIVGQTHWRVCVTGTTCIPLRRPRTFSKLSGVTWKVLVPRDGTLTRAGTIRPARRIVSASRRPTSLSVMRSQGATPLRLRREDDPSNTGKRSKQKSPANELN